MNDILLPVGIVAGIGLLAGLILAVASVLMAVPKDRKTEELRAMLPGANCGACGFSGCDGYAAALSKGEARPGLCTVGGADTAKKLSEYLGVDAGSPEERRAVVRCLGSDDNTGDKVRYEGIRSCAAAVRLAGGPASCSYGCIGFGDCAKACQFGAISVRNGVAMVVPERCTGCSLCAAACPKQLIAMVPVKKQASVLCSSCDKGNVLGKVCSAGCIGCMKCEKTCHYGAIRVQDFLASVDPQKCTGCGECAAVCPRHVIVMGGTEN